VAPGDTIVAVNGVPVDRMKLRDVTALITSPAPGAGIGNNEVVTLVFRSKRRGGDVYAVNVSKPARGGSTSGVRKGGGDLLWEEEHPNRAATPAQEMSHILEPSRAVAPPRDLDLHLGKGLARSNGYSEKELYFKKTFQSQSVGSLRATWADDRWGEGDLRSEKSHEGGLRSSFADLPNSLRNSFAELPDWDWLLGSGAKDNRPGGSKGNLPPETDLHPDKVCDSVCLRACLCLSVCDGMWLCECCTSRRACSMVRVLRSRCRCADFRSPYNCTREPALSYNMLTRTHAHIYMLTHIGSSNVARDIKKGEHAATINLLREIAVLRQRKRRGIA
jgi:hypothetical protein